MEGSIRARSESDGSQHNHNHFTANPDLVLNSSDTNLVGMADKTKHVEFEDTLEHRNLGASKSTERIMRSR